MKQQLIFAARVFGLTLWLLVLATVFYPEVLTWSDVLHKAALIVLVAHFVELILFKKLVRNVGDGIAMMLFGVLHVVALKSRE